MTASALNPVRLLRRSNLALRTAGRHYCDKKDPDPSPLKKLLDDAASFRDAKDQQQWVTLPYAKGARSQNQGEYKLLPRHDPRDTAIMLFPGQGSQYVGMAKNLLKFPMARDLFELANYVLGYDLLELCLRGPKEKLDQTQYCQPAVLVTSLAAIERLKEERPNAVERCVAAAGFSLGEITALVFAGALQFEQALRLVQVRGLAMQAAGEAYPGGMAALVYGPDSKVNHACARAREWAADRGDPLAVCAVANYLSPNAKVASGSASAIDYLERNYREFNIRRVKRLPVSGGFHSELMRPAVEPFVRALRKCEVAEPAITVYSNVDGKRYRSAKHIVGQLPKQIVKPVKWEQTLHVVYERGPDDHFPRTFECGPGTQLKNILKQVNLKAWNSCYNVEA